MILKLNSIDILTASPHYFCKKCMEREKENLLLDLSMKTKLDYSFKDNIGRILLILALQHNTI